MSAPKIRVSTYTGSIVDRAVDAHAIVNASNPSVGLGSGVSGAIRDACGGASFQVTVREALEAEFGEPLSAEDCLVTTAGTCDSFRWVLHVPAVDYTRRDADTGGVTGPTRVASCLRAALEEVATLARLNDLSGRFRLATPLLGAGHGGLGVVVSADIMMGALRAWALAHHDASPLAEIRFVVLDDLTARTVARAAEKHGMSSAHT
jgi:O-acetyl-ADP-ribose deacetylase (regulator of RNase III)